MTHQPSTVDFLMIGHFAKDEVVHRGQRETTSGGSVYYGAIALRRLGFSVAVATRLARADFDRLEELKAEGILVFAQTAPETSGIENVYVTEDMNRRLCRPLNFAGPFRLEDIPEIPARTIIVGPIMAGEVDLPLLKALASRGARLALDAQGFVRVIEGDNLIFRDWPDKAEGLSYVNVLKADDAEAEVLTGQTDPKMAARALSAYGPDEIVLTHGGGLLVYAQGESYQAPFHPRQIRGRTGRGDTTFATYLGERLTAPPDEACRFAAAVASLKMEQPGPFRRQRQDVEAFLSTAYAGL
jgi:sugar/nucleoside kinase (ribokinase family)